VNHLSKATRAIKRASRAAIAERNATGARAIVDVTGQQARACDGWRNTLAFQSAQHATQSARLSNQRRAGDPDPVRFDLNLIALIGIVLLIVT